MGEKKKCKKGVRKLSRKKKRSRCNVTRFLEIITLFGGDEGI